MLLWDGSKNINELVSYIPIRVPEEYFTRKTDYGERGILVDYLVSRTETPIAIIAKENDPSCLFVEMDSLMQEILEHFCDGQYTCGDIINIFVKMDKADASNAKIALSKLYKVKAIYFVKRAEDIPKANEKFRVSYKPTTLPMEILFSYISKRYGIPYMFAPSKFSFVVTNKCNARCTTCYRGNIALGGHRKHRSELTTREIFAIIDNLNLIGTDRIKFLGGEPFCRDDIFRLIEYAQNKNMIVEVSSNGLLLSKDPFVENISKLNPNLFRLAISIDGLEKGQNSQRVGADFKTVICSFEKLKQAGIEFSTNTIVSRNNMKEMDSLVKLLSRYKVASRFQIMKACGTGIENLAHILSPVEKRDTIQVIDEAGEKYGLRLNNALVFPPFIRLGAQSRRGERARYHRCRACTYGMV